MRGDIVTKLRVGGFSSHSQVALAAPKAMSPPNTKTVSVVVPAFNEAERLPRTLDALTSVSWSRDIELIVVDDGSTDGTAEVAEKHLVPHENSGVVRLARNVGKGHAVRVGIARARGSAVVFMDADLATDLSSLSKLVEALDDAEVAIGSRSAADAVVIGASMKRAVMGRAFNLFVRAVTGVTWRDTQCGFKAFRPAPGRLLFELSHVDRFAFDVELLLLSRLLGYRVQEVPVMWTDRAGSKVTTLPDSLAAARDVLRAHTRRSMLDHRIVSVSVRHSGGPSPSGGLLENVRQLVRDSDTLIDAAVSVTALLPLCSDRVGHTVASRLRRKFPDLSVTVGSTPVRALARTMAAAPETGFVPSGLH